MIPSLCSHRRSGFRRKIARACKELRRAPPSLDVVNCGRLTTDKSVVTICRNNGTWGTLPMAAWLVPLDFDLDNLRAALQWSLVERHDVTLGAAIAVAQQTVLELLSLV